MKTKRNVSIGKSLLQYGVYIAFVIIVLVLGMMSKNFFTISNLLNVLRQVSFNGILALGMTFVIITGGIDLSVGSTVAMAGLIALSLSIEEKHIPLVVALAAGLGVGLLIGFINGVLIAKAKLAPFIVTLSTMTIVRGLALVYCNGRPITRPSDGYSFIGQGYLFGISIPIYVYVVLIIICVILLHFNIFGRHVLAVGGNEDAARASGLKTDRIKIEVYMLSGLFSAVVGIVLSSRANAASPISGEGYELNAIAASVIGGVSMTGGIGAIYGTVIGAMIIGVLSNGLDLLNVSSYYQQIIKGLIILVAVLMDKKSK